MRFLKPSLVCASSVRWLRSTLRSRTRAVVDEVRLEAEQRLDAVLLGRLVELDGAVHDAVVGQADGRLAELGRARSASLSMLQAPSSSEYSEWTWRCAQPGLDTGDPD